MNRLIKNWQLINFSSRQMLFAVFLVSCILSLDSASAQIVLRPAKQPTGGIDSGEVNKLFYSALIEKAADRNTQAADMFNQVLAIDAANDASLYELATIKKAQNKLTEAQPMLEKAVAIKPNNEWYWNSLAEIYEKNNDIVKLENVFDQLIRISPERAEYYYNKANILTLEKKYDDALAMYDKVEKIMGPSDDLVLNRQKIYLKQGKVDKAAAGLEQMIATNPGQIRYYLMLSDIYFSNNASDKALKVLEKAKTVDPNDPRIHLVLADIYNQKKNYDAGYKELQLAFANPDLAVDEEIRIVMGYLPKFPDPVALSSALELSKMVAASHPNDARANALYGDMLLQNGKFKEAKISYKRSLELDNQVYQVREQLVRLELNDGEIDNVIKDGEDALSFFPNQGWMNYFVGLAWSQKKDYKKAMGYFKNTAAVEFQDKELLSLTYSALGDCYHEALNNKSSDESYDKALTYNPDNAYALNNYAYYLSIRNEQLDKAETMAKHATAVQPNVASFEDTYAWILFKQKDYKNAKTWIEKALADGKEKSATQTEHYGDILFYLGDVDAAVQNWKKAKDYGSHSAVLDRKINEKKYIE